MALALLRAIMGVRSGSASQLEASQTSHLATGSSRMAVNRSKSLLVPCIDRPESFLLGSRPNRSAFHMGVVTLAPCSKSSRQVNLMMSIDRSSSFKKCYSGRLGAS